MNCRGYENAKHVCSLNLLSNQGKGGPVGQQVLKLFFVWYSCSLTAEHTRQQSLNAFFLETNCFNIYRYHHFHYTLVAQKNSGYNLKESIIDLPVLLIGISLKHVVLRLLELISETAFPDK